MNFRSFHHFALNHTAARCSWVMWIMMGLIWACILCISIRSVMAHPLSTESGLPLPAFEVDQARCDPHRAVRKSKRAYRGPLIDVHAHLYPPLKRDAGMGDIDRLQLEQILDMLQVLEVERIFLMPTPNDGIRRNQELGGVRRSMIRSMNPQRVRLFGGSNYITTWLHRAFHEGYTSSALRRRLDMLSREIDSGEISGVGELAIYHFNKGYGKQHVLSFSPDFKPWLEIVDLIARRGMWMDLHVEPVDPQGKSYERQAFGGLELLYRRHPDLKLIYSHTAMTCAVNVRRMLACYPQLVMSIKIEPRHDKWRNLAPVVNTRGEVYQDWAMLFEEQPERFMIGTDFHFGRKGVDIRKYKQRVKKVRQILGALRPQAADLIASGNARRLFP